MVHDRRPKPRRRWFSQRSDDEAASEVVATTILVVISVSLLSTFGATVLSTVTSETPTPPVGTFTLRPLAGATSVNVTLVSGSTLDVAGTAYSLQVNGSDRTGDVYVVNETLDGKWTPGQALHVNVTGGALTAGQTVFFIAVDRDSGKSIGMANAPVPSPGDGTPVHTNVLTATLSFSTDGSALPVDGKTSATALVQITATNGLVLVRDVRINLSSVNGPGSLLLSDDGVEPDETPNDGWYSANFTLSNYTFSSLPGNANLTLGVNATDVLGQTVTDTATLWIGSPPVSKVRAGTEFRDIGSSAVISYDGFLNLSSFTFRDITEVDNDQIEVRVSDLDNPLLSWSATVTFKSPTGGACTQPSIVNVVMRKDTMPGASITWTPTNACFTVGTNAKINLANLSASLDNASEDWTWTNSTSGGGSESTLSYANASIGSSNEAVIAFFGDSTTLLPTETGLGQADLTWAPPLQNVAATLPSAPRSLAATAGSGSVALTWVAPATAGGTVTNYHIYVGEVSGDTTWIASTGGSNTSFTVNGLTNGVTYFFNVTAENALGQGPSTNEVSATPTTTPGAPTGLSGTKGNKTIALSWTAPASTGGSAITNYYIYLSTTSGATTYFAATGGSNTSFTANGLSNGQTYFFNVTAVNANGQGASSTEASATPSTIPEPPASLVATAGSNQVSLSWSAGATGGSALTGYSIYRGIVPGVTTLLATTTNGGNTSFLDATAINGVTYYYNITATNANGVSATSNQASATPSAAVTAPSAPQSLSATRGNGSVALSWSAPASNGGSAITTYNIYVGTASGVTVYTATTGGSNTTFTVNGLTNGVPYYFNVTAVNAVGQGPTSNEATATPASVTYPPASLGATAGNRSVTLSWTAPANIGGSALTDYYIYRGTTSGAATYLAATGGTNTSFVVNGLTNGQQYFFNVTAVNAVGQSATSNEASATPVAIPYPPGSLAAAAGDTSATLTWSTPPDNGGSALTNFKIYVGTSSGATTYLASTGSGANTSFTVNGLTNGQQYFFNVTAVNAIGESASSNEATTAPAGLPSAPLSPSATKGNRTVTLSWSAPASTGGSAITNYYIYRGTSSGATTYLAATGGTNTTFVVNGLTNGQQYFFNITAVNANGQGTTSAEVSATPSTIPNPPASLGGTAGNQSVLLSWSAPADIGGSAITTYNVYRGTSSGATVYIGTTGGTNTSWTAGGLTNGQQYFFNVTAVNANGQSAGSNEIARTPVTVPYPPTALSATKGNGSVSLSWTAPSDNGGSTLTAYSIYRGTSSGTETFLATIGTNTSFVSNGLTNGQIYYYYVTASNAAGEGNPSNEASATPSTVPYPPTSLSATRGNGSASLSWTAPSNTGGSAITNYNIYRGTSTGVTTFLASTGGSNTSFISAGLTNGVTYYYNVTAVNANGQGSSSNEASVTPATTPNPPSTLTVTNLTASQLDLSWSAGSNGGSAITAYEIWRGTSSGSLSLLTTIGTNTTYVDLNVAVGTTYYYQIRAINAIGTSNPSAEASKAVAAPSGTVPGAPTNLTLTPANQQVALNWTAPTFTGGSAITNYAIYRSTTNSSGTMTLLATIGTNTTYVDLGLTNGTTYYYQVRAVNANGLGNLTSIKDATPNSAVSINCSSLTNLTGTISSCTALQSADFVNATLSEGGGGSSKTFAAEFSVNVTGLSGRQTLEMQGYQSQGAENLFVQAWNFTSGAWETIATLDSSSSANNPVVFSGFVYSTQHWPANVMRIKLVDAGPDPNNSSWTLDYVRMVTT